MPREDQLGPGGAHETVKRWRCGMRGGPLHSNETNLNLAMHNSSVWNRFYSRRYRHTGSQIRIFRGDVRWHSGNVSCEDQEIRRDTPGPAGSHPLILTGTTVGFSDVRGGTGRENYNK